MIVLMTEGIEEDNVSPPIDADWVRILTQLIGLAHSGGLLTANTRMYKMLFCRESSSSYMQTVSV